MKARFALKSATDDLHRRLDDQLSRLDLADPGDYTRFLLFQARLVPPLEDALAAAGLDQLVPGWTSTRRSEALRRDLDAVGAALPPPAPVSPPEGTAAMLGMAYVLEGSRLGGRVLKSQVADGFSSAFLSDYAGETWPSLIEVLDSSLYSGALLGKAKDAARDCFALFLDVANEAGI